MNNNDIICNWIRMETVNVIQSYKPLKKLLDTWKYPPKILIGRSPIMEIPKSYWPGLGDPIFEALYHKQNFFEKYFAVGIYTVNTDPRKVQTILAGIDTAIETTIEVTSSIKNTLNTYHSIKNLLNASGIIPKISLNLAAALETEFSVMDVKEVSSSKIERTTKSVKIGASVKNRMFVPWLFSEAVAIYRKRKNGKVELIAISEWPTQVIDKIYEY